MIGLDIDDERAQTRRPRLVLFGRGPIAFRALSSNVQMHKCALKRYAYLIFVNMYYVLALQTKIKE